jgi:hypothetical protein
MIARGLRLATVSRNLVQSGSAPARPIQGLSRCGGTGRCSDCVVARCGRTGRAAGLPIHGQAAGVWVGEFLPPEIPSEVAVLTNARRTPCNCLPQFGAATPHVQIYAAAFSAIAVRSPAGRCLLSLWRESLLAMLRAASTPGLAVAGGKGDSAQSSINPKQLSASSANPLMGRCGRTGWVAGCPLFSRAIEPVRECEKCKSAPPREDPMQMSAVGRPAFGAGGPDGAASWSVHGEATAVRTGRSAGFDRYAPYPLQLSADLGPCTRHGTDWKSCRLVTPWRGSRAVGVRTGKAPVAGDPVAGGGFDKYAPDPKQLSATPLRGPSGATLPRRGRPLDSRGVQRMCPPHPQPARIPAG